MIMKLFCATEPAYYSENSLQTFFPGGGLKYEPNMNLSNMNSLPTNEKKSATLRILKNRSFYFCLSFFLGFLIWSTLMYFKTPGLIFNIIFIICILSYLALFSFVHTNILKCNLNNLSKAPILMTALLSFLFMGTFAILFKTLDRKSILSIGIIGILLTLMHFGLYLSISISDKEQSMDMITFKMVLITSVLLGAYFGLSKLINLEHISVAIGILTFMCAEVIISTSMKNFLFSVVFTKDNETRNKIISIILKCNYSVILLFILVETLYIFKIVN